MNRRIRASVLFFLVLLISGKHSVAQSFSYKNYSTENGLNSSLVYSCAQDSKGYMWFCTDAGVSRFDGIKFELFTRNDGLSDNEVFQLFEDSKGRIWFLTYNGHLSYYLNGKFYNEENTPMLHGTFLGESYTTAFEDHRGHLYFGSFGSKFIVLDTNHIVTYNVDQAYGTFSFFENDMGEVFVTSQNICNQIKNNALIRAPLKYLRKDVRYIYSVFGNEYYFSEEGLIRKNKDEELLIIPARLLPPYNSITGCRENPDSSFLISTRGNGALLFPFMHSYENCKPIRILPNKIILSDYIDNENNIWLNTEGDGVYMLSAANKNISSYTLADGLANLNINRVIKDVSGATWLACGGRTITQIKNDSVYNYQLNTLIKNRNDRALDFVFDNAGILWVATDNGIFKFRPGSLNKLVALHQDGIETHPSSKSISTDLNGNIVLTYFMGVAKLHVPSNPRNDFFESVSGTEFKYRTFTHFVDHESHLWIANINGLNRWDNGKLFCYGDSDQVLKSRITQIKELNNTLILSTDHNGIIFFKENKITYRITQKNGLPSDICRKIFIRENNLWVCTNLGLASIELEHESIKEIKTFDATDGLLSNDIHDVLDDGNHIYIATDKGLSELNKLNEMKAGNPPPVYISKIMINNHALNAGEDINKLTYNQNSILVNFIAITFQNPEKITYQYKLNKNNSEWINTRNSTIEFSNLAPGNYTFTLRAKKINSRWSNPVSFGFIIHPPFWKTTWFIILLILVVFSILIFVQRVYSGRKLHEQLAEVNRRELILRERSRISSDMHDDLGSDLSKLVVLTEVMRVTENLNQSTSSNLDKISRYAMDLRGTIDEIIWALNPRHDSLADLISYIHQYALDYFEEGLPVCHVSLPPLIPEIQVSAAFRRNVFLIVKESLHNIRQHAKGSEVNINIEIDKSMLVLSVSDNGQGFEQDNKKLSGNGLNNMNKRAIEICGDLTFTTSPGTGCKVELICVFAT